MKKQFFTVGQTYSEVTPESAAIGDFSDTGWEQEKSKNWSLQDIIYAVQDQGREEISYHGGNSVSIYGWSATVCYRTGTEKQLCLHVEGAERNIKRLINIIKKEA